jgi:hypothetical protein
VTSVVKNVLHHSRTCRDAATGIMKVRLRRTCRFQGVWVLRLRRTIRFARRPALLRMTRGRVCQLTDARIFKAEVTEDTEEAQLNHETSVAFVSNS